MALDRKSHRRSRAAEFQDEIERFVSKRDCELIGLTDLSEIRYKAFNLLKPLLPKRRVVDVYAERLEQRLRRADPRPQEREYSARSFALSLYIRKALVREWRRRSCSSKARVDEVRDIRPTPAVAVGHVDGGTVVFAVGVEPKGS